MKKISVLIFCMLMVVLVGCSAKTNVTKSVNATPKVKLTAQSIFDKLKETEAKSITKVVIVDADHDESGLFGRPNQYTEKIEWKDSRIQNSQVTSSIEVFKTAEDATARKTYLEGIIKSMPTFIQYIEQKDNILLRIEGGLKPAQSNEYIKVFKAM